MWRSSVGVALLSAVAIQAAAAADPAPLKAPAKVRAYDWSGFYLGGHFGYSRGRGTTTLFDPGPASSSAPLGALYGGVQFGYNHLLPSGLLLGVEADFSFPNFLETDDLVAARTTTRDSTVTERLDYVGRVRGRVGYAFDRWLVYGIGGLAWSQARFTESPLPVP